MPVSFSGIRGTSNIMVGQGGTGNSSLTQGGVLIGQGSDPVAVITGSDGQILTWISGTWVAADNAGGNGGGLSTVNTSGNIEGDGSAGTPVILKDDISLSSVTASFNGDGSGITNIPNSALQNSSININGTDVQLGGLFTITVPQSGISAVNVSGSGITGSGTPGNPLYITSIPNDKLDNSSITINGTPISLGGSVTVADQSSMYFTAAGFAAGDIVALSGSLVKADYSDDTKSNAFGVVSAVSGTSVTVKVFGEVTALSASNYPTAGTLVYVGPSGSVVNYSSIPSGKYITQIGIISPSSGKVIIQPRIFGQKN
jgi:hypothetical protein